MKMSQDNFQGYSEAAKIDRMIIELLKKFKIEDAPLEWVRSSRTLKTTMNIILEEAKRKDTK